MTTKTKHLALALLAAALLAAALAPAASAEFGAQAFDGQVSAGPAPSPIPDEGEPADPANFAPPFTQAAGHPYAISTQILFNTATDPVNGPSWPVEPIHDVITDIPPGLIGNPGAVEHCSSADLASPTGRPTCAPASQAGIVKVDAPFCLFPGFCIPLSTAAVGLYAMEAPTGIPARFGFNVAGTVVNLDARLRDVADAEGGYALSLGSRGTSQALPIIGVELVLWGAPADPVHTPERDCPDEIAPSIGGKPCEAGVEPAALLTLPSACAGPQTTTVHADSWFHRGALDSEGEPDLSDPSWKSASFTTHLPGGLSDQPGGGGGSLPPIVPVEEWGAPQGATGCEKVPFNPSLTLTPTSDRADSPTGLEVDLSVPQNALSEYGKIAQSDLKEATVTLPEGMSVNPSSADGLGGCTLAQIGLHSQALPSCPDSSKIGTVAIATPLLDHPVDGSVYLAAQGDNPFGSLLAMYLVGEDPGSGVVVKLPGKVTPSASGRLVASFQNQPQLPFSNLHLQLKGGSRATLRTPGCGTHAATASLAPWSGNPPVELSSSFQIDKGCGGGFDPKLSAGTENPVAGVASPFTLRLTREDGEQQLGGLTVSLPPGLSGYLKGIPYCPEAALAAISDGLGTGRGQEVSPSCPAASQVGTVTVGAGSGPSPFYTSAGRAYLAGPYKGAPLSLAVVAPAVAGPFDLGSVLVRNALRVDPETAQITAVSDPLPTALHGIPLDLRDVRVELSRERFTLNPTSCEAMQVRSTITSSGGASADPSQRFQVADCGALAFKPKLALRLFGKTHRNAHPRLRAVLTMPEGGANIARAAVTLPKTELLENAHIRTICTRVQYAAGRGGGEQCPPASVYGHARAFSPLLGQPLEGPVYLRSSSHPLPDLVASLGGQIHVDLVGRIDAVHARIRNTFEAVPDAPVSKFVLEMQGGKKGLLANNTDICRAKPRATALFDGQNGKTHDIAPVVKASCGKGKHRRR